MTKADDAYSECLDLEVAVDLVFARIGRVVRAKYAEEAKAEPDAAYMAALKQSHSAAWDDRRALHGASPETVAAMIEKYTRLAKAEDLTAHE